MMMRKADSKWSFLSNHTHVLVLISSDSKIRVRDISDKVGITERAVMRILGELEESHIITRHRSGRRSSYEVHGEKHLRHSIEAERTVAELLDFLRLTMVDNS